MQKERKDMDRKFQWDLSKMYTDEKWEKDYLLVESLAKDFLKYKGRLTESGDILLQAIEEFSFLEMKLSGLYVFARMKKDEDNTSAESFAREDKVQGLASKVQAMLAFFYTDLLSVKYERIKNFYKEQPKLLAYEFMLEEIFRNESHTLSEAEEALLSKLSPIFSASDDTFTMLQNADMYFGMIKDENGEELPLTLGSYNSFMISPNREIRKQAYEGLYEEFKKHKNTLATTLGYSVKTDAIVADIKKYPSSLERALHPDNIPVSVYDNLIRVVHENLPLLHRYLELRRRILKLDKLKMYDMYVPLLSLENERVEYEEGVELMKKALEPLGEDYLCKMNEGLNSGWIDVYENKGKTSGAYSFGSYESMPYILLNYDNTLRDVFTLVHEMGHSMHSLYTRKNQPYVYSNYSLFTAEVASTVNESLLADHLIKNAKDDRERLYLINMYLEGFRTTIFRQTMFAEFEQITHKAVEEGGALSVDFLCDEYLKLNRKYFGENVDLDENIAMEWSRIPHFYSAFYVYKYATGYSAATAISKKILKEGETAAKAYIDFLKSGGSDYPVELLKIAGIDMSTSAPIELAFKTFEELLSKMETILK